MSKLEIAGITAVVTGLWLYKSFEGFLYRLGLLLMIFGGIGYGFARFAAMQAMWRDATNNEPKRDQPPEAKSDR